MGRGSKFYFGKTRGYYKSVNFSNENVDPEQGTEETPKRNKFPIGAGQEKHIFRDEEKHFIDTPENRQLIEDLSNNDEKKLGTDSRGLDWYSDISEDGRQIWVSVRNGIIQNCGYNKKGDHRPFDNETGLCLNPKKHPKVNKKKKNRKNFSNWRNI